MARGGVKEGDGENTKKKPSAAAKRAEKQKTADKQQKAVVEDEEWSKGAKSNAKKEAEAEKKAEVARKKAEKDAIIAQEEKDARALPKNTKSATKKPVSKGLDLSQLDDTEASSSKTAPALAATGIDNALDALSLTAQDGTKIDKHPERRFKAAFAAYQERRLQEMEDDGSGQGLRKNQKEANIRKEFEKSPDNPFNQVNARYDASKDEVKELREAEKTKIESRLAEKN